MICSTNVIISSTYSVTRVSVSGGRTYRGERECVCVCERVCVGGCVCVCNRKRKMLDDQVNARKRMRLVGKES